MHRRCVDVFGNFDAFFHYYSTKLNEKVLCSFEKLFGLHKLCIIAFSVV